MDSGGQFATGHGSVPIQRGHARVPILFPMAAGHNRASVFHSGGPFATGHARVPVHMIVFPMAAMAAAHARVRTSLEEGKIEAHCDNVPPILI